MSFSRALSVTPKIISVVVNLLIQIGYLVACMRDLANTDHDFHLCCSGYRPPGPALRSRTSRERLSTLSLKPDLPKTQGRSIKKAFVALQFISQS